ncbi:ParA family protein [Pseudoteredinibacter isoporae]|uniref:Chromosome partitioning protein n=1 Tax=Pseudoteredinibacter isoporae TaxID=570281 RepID=A0A7X0JXE3_9GAMM|nr:ParA family protein [Pseudoteredinibacter isoporae]MBB6523448.1 chromosome partitioning protein [Pseudoteredinibacter isoporae]NHO88957.1 ParA family protein [Pseudoteredinibacter isoporae]NIB24335.1 ParA family protein [Pseudoteredinibacter isoporae]
MQVWTVANQKGGVGKTTSAVTLGGYAAQAGKRVLLVDLDAQGSMSSYFGIKPQSLKQSSAELLHHEGQVSRQMIMDIVMELPYEGLSLMPSSPSLITLERTAQHRRGFGLVLGQVLSLLEEDFDLVLIDCPPALGVLMINALVASTRLIIPVQAEFLSLQGFARMQQTVDMVQHSLDTVIDRVVVPTMVDRRTQACQQTVRSLRNEFPVDLWPGHIPIDTKLRDASRLGVPANLFQPAAKGVQAYGALYRFLEQRISSQRRVDSEGETFANSDKATKAYWAEAV